MSIIRARRILQVMGRKDFSIRLVDINRSRGRVFGQSPEAGAPLPRQAQEITLEIESPNPDAELPEIYREWDLEDTDYKGDSRPVGLLHRFLFVPQQIYGGLEESDIGFERNFDPSTAPAQFLPFLEALFPYEVYSGWDVKQRRRVLLRMPELLKKRGTAEGLEEMVQLYTELDVEVHENAWPYQGMVVGSVCIAEQPIVSQIPAESDAFYVELPEPDMEREVIERVHRVVDAEKPAHLQYCLYAPYKQAIIERNEAPLGSDFVVGESVVSGDVHTPAASLSVEEALPSHMVPGEPWRRLLKKKES